MSQWRGKSHNLGTKLVSECSQSALSCAKRSGVPTSTHRPWYSDAVTKPSSMARRSKGASGALTECGLPVGMPHRASLKNVFL